MPTVLGRNFIHATPLAISSEGDIVVNVLNWSIAGNTVNVLSTLKWKNMTIVQLQVAGEFHLKNDRRLRAKLGYNVINSGLR